MQTPQLLEEFIRFGLAALLGFLIGLEREMKAGEDTQTGLRDFVLYALLGAMSAYVAQQVESVWVIVVGFLAMAGMLMASFWAGFRRDREADVGITTEIAAFFTFFIGVLVAQGATEVSIALAIVVLAVLSKKRALSEFRRHVEGYELEATLKLLVITFIVLPILPRQPLDHYLTLAMGTVESVDTTTDVVTIELISGQTFEAGQEIEIYENGGRSLGKLAISDATAFRVTGNYHGAELKRLKPELQVRSELGMRFVSVMLSAIAPHKIWMIVVLVSSISFVGYVLVKVLGASAGIGLTGIVGGLASSTVTTLSFARRSLETPLLNRHFAVAVILASSVMFPRLLLQIAVVNQALMKRMLVPICVTGLTGLLVAAVYFFRSRRETVEATALKLDNPFSLGSALKFTLVFATTLMVTNLALHYLGDAWLPLVAIVSGLTDADAIAFSVSSAQQSGQISLDWAALNAVLGALANTLMKLMLVLFLGHRGLFKQLLLAFIVIETVGLVTMFFYYDLSGVFF